MTKLRKEKFDQPMEFDQYLGQLDMELHPKWKQAWIGQNQELFEAILHDMGADLNFGYEFSVCLYRARTTNKVEYGVRVSFKERSDKWWVDNMMNISDVVRNTQGSIRSTGMRQALNEDSPLNEAMIEACARNVSFVDIKVDMGDEKKEESK